MIEKLLTDTGAMLNGHFLLSSGLHSNKYIQCALLMQWPVVAEQVSKELAKLFVHTDVDVVVGPAMGGIVLVYEVARIIERRAIFTERENGEMVLRRGFSLSPCERVIVLEDVVTTGGSLMDTINLCKKNSAYIVDIGTIIDRSSKDINFGRPLHSLLKLEIKTWSKEDCPMCKDGVKLVKPGSREIHVE